ncbi:uncharacterized protein LOC125371698 isoform X2 [Haliotis rufescens]|uniref:uncharacterized protein LOC125371698 isoform X2 n=1 Tax=Haliotis rufescens TaxID=6454 RepID=UPI00201EE753|nr:uncharacterized protein LOC125371698 isoform X2 [Haliotis rufescens]
MDVPFSPHHPYWQWKMDVPFSPHHPYWQWKIDVPFSLHHPYWQWKMDVPFPPHHPYWQWKMDYYLLVQFRELSSSLGVFSFLGLNRRYSSLVLPDD